MEIEQPEIVSHLQLNSQNSEEQNNGFYEWISVEEDSVRMDSSLDFQNQLDQSQDIESNPAIESFRRLFSDSLLELIVDRTNTYAQNSIRQEYEKFFEDRIPDKPFKDFFKSNWKPLTPKESKSFLSCVLLMGIIEKPNIHDYWTIHHLTQSPSFCKIMSRNRFEKIMRYLHVSNDKPSLHSHQFPNNDRLRKIKDIITKLNSLWQSSYSIDKNIVIDESICGFQGRLAFKQYLPMKSQKWGIKCYCLSDSVTGYTYNIIVYTGKNQTGTTNAIVKKLVEGLEYKNYHLFLDNYFVTIPLLQDLRGLGFGITGTVRKNRLKLCSGLKKLDQTMQKGESKFFTYDNFLLVFWRDRRILTAISSVYGTGLKQMQSYDKIKKEFQIINKPNMIDSYSKYMHGVDKSDQVRSYYSFFRKTRKWWKKLLFYLIEINLSNSYLIYTKFMISKSKIPLTMKDFRIAIIKYLLIDIIKYQDAEIL